MINLEKYKDELVKSGRFFGVSDNNTVEKCNDLRCGDCIFRSGNCFSKRYAWLFEREKR